LGEQIDAGSLLRDLHYKSDSSTRKELEKEQGSADEVTIRDTSDSLLNLPNAGFTQLGHDALPVVAMVARSSRERGNRFLLTSIRRQPKVAMQEGNGSSLGKGSYTIPYRRALQVFLFSRCCVDKRH
jgi:hypothetical protein